MLLSTFLILAFIVGTTTSQSDFLADLSPAWLIGTGSGVIQTTKIPTTSTLTRIVAAESAEPSSKFIAAFDFQYGSYTSIGWAPASGGGYSLKSSPNVRNVDSGQYLAEIKFCLSNTNEIGGFGYEFLNPSSSQVVHLECSNWTHTYAAATGNQIVGLEFERALSGLGIHQIRVYYRDCTSASRISLDVTYLEGSKNIFTGAASTATFSVTDNTSNSCGTMEYDVSYAVTSATTNLISLGSGTTVTFMASNLIGDVKSYTVTVRARFTGQTAWVTSATVTYTYINPCNSASIIFGSHPDITTTVWVPASSSTALWYDSVSGSASSQVCGGFTPTFQFTATPSSFDNSTMGSDFNFTRPSPHSTLTVDPKWQPQEVGSYTIEFKVCLTLYPSQCAVTSTSVTIGNCIVTSVRVEEYHNATGDFPLQPQTYCLCPNTSFQYALLARQTPDCGYPSSGWTVSATGTTTESAYFAPIVSSHAEYELYYFPATNQANRVGVYTITITALTINGVTYGSLGSTSLSAPYSFTLDVGFYTVTAVKVVWLDYSPLNDQTYIIGDPADLHQLVVIQTPACNFPTIIEFDPKPSFSSFDQVNKILSFQTSDLNAKGQHNVAVSRVTVGFEGFSTYPVIGTPSSFKLNVMDPCSATTVLPATIGGRTIILWQQTTEMVFDEFADSVSLQGTLGTCSKTYTASISNNAGGLSIASFQFDSTSRKLNFYSNALNQLGTYTVTLTGTVTLFPTRSATTTFTITVMNPCLTTSLSDPTPPLQKMVTSVLVALGAKTQQVHGVIDQVSASQSTTGLCGPLQYSIRSTKSTAISQDDLTAVELSISSSGLISVQVQTPMSATVGLHDAIVVVHLVDYPSCTIELSFEIEIESCVVTSYSIDNLVPDTYIIADVSHQRTLNTLTSTQVPSCGYYSEFLGFDQIPSFVNADNSTLSYQVFTRDLAHAGTHYIPVISTLIDNSYTPPRVVLTSSQSQVLTLQNPCLSTAITIFPAYIGNLVAFSGQSTQSQMKYSFNDSESLSRTQPPDKVDFCGEKLLTFTINGTATAILYAVNNDFIEFSPPTDSTNFGVGQAQVTASMKRYQTIQSSPMSFTVTILGSVVPKIPDYNYLTRSVLLKIEFDEFVVLPYDFDAGPFALKAYIFTGEEWPGSINLTCSCLETISDLSWIQFHAATRTFVVSTSSDKYVGVHRIIVVQSFTDFPNFTPFTMFSINITASNQVEPKFEMKPPFFTTPLEPQKVEQQCDGLNIGLWSLQLPEYSDPYDSVVTVSVQLKNDFFSYDKKTMLISQKKTIDKPVNQTIKVTLENDFDSKAIYSILVQFLCKTSQKTTFNFTELDQATKQKKWPQAYIAFIEPSGLMHVKFNQKMKIPEHPEQIQNETVTLADEKVYPILRFSIIPGNYSDSSRLTFNWTFVEFRTTELLIQLNFSEPQYVSSQNLQPDRIKLTIFGYMMFADELGNFMYPGTELKPKILPLISSQDEAATAQEIADIFQGAVQAVVLGNVVVSLLIAGPLQQLLNSVKQLQVIVHIILINVAYPATATIFFGMLMGVLTFQFYDFSDFYNRILQLDPDSRGSNPLNNQFYMLGYNTLFIIQNFGTLCWTIFIAPVGWAFASLIVPFIKGEFISVRTKFNRLMFYNYWIGFLNETCIFLAVCVALNLVCFEWHAYGEAVNSLVALMFGLALILFPFFVGVFYVRQKNYDLIKKRDQEFLSRFGSAIDGLNFKRRGKLVLIHACASIIRKLSLAYMVVFMQEYPVISIFIVNFQALLMIITSGTIQPMTEMVGNRMELFNEAFVLLTTYHLYQFTEFMTDLQNRSYVGKSLMILIIVNVLINIGVTVIQTSTLAARRLKLRYLRWRQNKRIKEQFDKKLQKAAARQQFISSHLRLKEQTRGVQKSNNFINRQVIFIDDQEDHSRDLRPKHQQKEKLEAKSQSEPRKSVIQNKQKPPSDRKPSNSFHTLKLKMPGAPKGFSIPLRSPRLGAIGSKNWKAYKTLLHKESETIGSRLVPVKVKKENLLWPNQQKNSHEFVKPLQEENISQLFREEKERKDRQESSDFQTKTLISSISVMNQEKIELQEVRKAGRIVRFALYLAGESYFNYDIADYDDAFIISSIREKAFEHAMNMEIDFCSKIKKDIDSGTFKKVLEAYEIKRRSYLNTGYCPPYEEFMDFGPYDPTADLRSNITLYEELRSRSNLLQRHKSQKALQ